MSINPMSDKVIVTNVTIELEEHGDIDASAYPRYNFDEVGILYPPPIYIFDRL
jgi:hypothetical protein